MTMDKEAQDKLKIFNEEELKKVYRNVFETEEGKIVLQDLRNRSFFYSTTMKNSFANNESIFFNEGVRCSVLHIETMLREEDNIEEKNKTIFGDNAYELA